MVTFDILLTIDTAFDMEDGTPGRQREWFVRGGHYKDAFVNAVVRMLGDEYGEVLTVPIEHLRPYVHWTWWVEVPVDDPEGGGWEYRACRDDTPGSYPVTRIEIDEVRRLAVYRCRHCWDGNHQDCQIRTMPAQVVTLHEHTYSRRGPLRDRRWKYDPRPY